MIRRFWGSLHSAGKRGLTLARAAWGGVRLGLGAMVSTSKGRRLVAVVGVVAAVIIILWKPPLGSVAPGEVGIRVNRLTGGVGVLPPGPVLVLPWLNDLRRYSLREQVYRPQRSATAQGEASFQSLEGLSLGVEITVRWALDPKRISDIAQHLPEDVGHDLIEPVVDGVLHRTISRHSVRDVFTAKRTEIQGHVDLPAEYRHGLEALLGEELSVDKMKYTLEMKGKEVEQKTLEAEAQKAVREKAAEAQAMEEIIAAKGKAEAMKHVLPFKEKEIEQRRLEAEAQKVVRLKEAEGQAEARKIEVLAEADARHKLADVEAYRMEVTGKAASDQMERDSRLIAANPLLIQKAMADKLSDKIQVIVAPPSTSGFLLSAVASGRSETASAPPHRPVATRDGAGPTAGEEP